MGNENKLNEFKNNIQEIINDNIEQINEIKFNNNDFMPIETLQKYIEQLKKSVCKIKIDNSYGTGILLKIQKGNDLICALITCEHVIEKKLIEKKIFIEIDYNYIQDKYNKIEIELNEDKRFIRNFRYLNLDITIVQILNEEIDESYFFEINSYQNEDLKDKTIYIFQFPKGRNELSCSIGKFLSKESSFRFSHSASTEEGSSGGPIFIFKDKLYLIGIHKGGLGNNNYGDFISSVINSLKQNYSYTKKREVINGIFEGETLPRNQFNGLLEKENEIYIGLLLHYIPNGVGTLYIKKNKKKKLLYHGNFNMGKYNGNGKLYYENKTYYKGDFNENKRHGKGILFNNKNEIIFEGIFDNDKYSEGRLFNDDGSYYEGSFLDNKKHGKGILYSKYNKIIYEGEFNNDTYKDNNYQSICIFDDDKEYNYISNQLLSILQPLGKNLGMKMKCNGCKCSTDDHHFNSETGYWHCEKCNSKCYNKIFNIFKRK